MPAQPSERVGVLAVANPGTVNSTPALSTAIDMSKFREAMFVLATGTMASETMDFKLQWSATVGGTYADVAGKAIAQIAAGSSSNVQAVINCKAEDLPATAQFVKGRAVTGGATGGPAVILGLGMVPVFGPAKTDNPASVVQVVT